MTTKDKIVELLKVEDGFTDREITDKIFGYGHPQQSTNIACRQMQEKGLIRRELRSDGKIGNFLINGNNLLSNHAKEAKHTVLNYKNYDTSNSYEGFSEDEIKSVLNEHLRAKGWNTQVAMGRDHGIDIDAYKGKDRWIIEVKGCGSRDAMRVNYFLAILGETLQRMNDPNARYSIALPNLRQFRNLWDRLPRLAKERTGITALFIGNDGSVEEVL